MKEVMITSGANGALSCFINALINKGDEVVLFEPAFPMLFDHIEMSGGTIKTVPLEENNEEWSFDPNVLRSVLSDNTKLLVMNSPHNPTGKLFTLEEQLEITEILEDFPNCVVLSDEVYDKLVFDDKEHVSFASLGDNWDRTVTLYSGGKLFLSTGWKVGWAIGPQRIVRLGGIINMATSYCSNHPA